MNFSDLEKIMAEKGIASLAEIARVLSTTPQAVSNWKSRDQIPYHVAVKLNQSSPLIADRPQASDQSPVFSAPTNFEEETISFSDILLTMAEQLKVIILVPFIAIFLTFTYVQFIQQPKYISSATVLLPDNKVGNLSGIGSNPALLIVDFVNGFTDPNQFGGGNINDAINKTSELLKFSRLQKFPNPQS